MSPKPTLRKAPIAINIPEQKPAPTIPSFDKLPDSAFIRESQSGSEPQKTGLNRTPAIQCANFVAEG